MNKHKIKRILVLFSIFFSFTILRAQNITLFGKAKDSLQKPVVNATILAIPKSSDLDIAYSISDYKGVFKLKLFESQDYDIKINHLGYKSKTIKLTTKKKDIELNFNLFENINELNEVVISSKIPIVIKKDTIIFNTDAFTTGKERKLRDVLKRLPMVEVDIEGNVTVRGKKVTKLLVENKEFFTGDPKLAVNNIPADVIDKIEVLDDFNDISFLKGLEESEHMAMNIKLKENKKKFVFGDIDSGVGIENRYLIHPSLYYYSPKTSINTIFNFNNIGAKTFTFKEFLEFEGDISALLTNSKSYFTSLNNDFGQFLGNQDFTANRNQFGALNLTQDISTNTVFSTYAIWSDTKNSSRQESFNDYFVSDNLIENRTNTENQQNHFGIGKVKLKIKPNTDTDITVESFIKASSNSLQNNTSTITEENSNIINTYVDADNFSIKQDLQWHRKFSTKHTTSTVFNYQYQKATPNTNWLTDETILQGLIPVIDEDTYNIFKNKEIKAHNLNLVLKHYWVLNRFNHIYFALGSQLSVDQYLTNEFQLLENGSVNDFSTSNFSNDTGLNFNDTFFGMYYKVQKGRITFKPALFYHYYNWNRTQFEQRITNNKAILLPELTTGIEFNSTKKLTFKYNLKTRFPNISQLANRFTLLSFNNIYQGNELLENELYHFVQLRFYRFSIFKDLFYNLKASYRVKEDNFKNTTTIQGIDFISSPVLSDFDDRVWDFNGSIKKGFGKYKFSINGSLSLADYENPISTEIIANTSNNYSFGGGIKTRFKNFPNFELDYTKSISKYRTNRISEFQTDIFSTYVEYDFFNDFILKADYSFENYENKTFDATNTFDIANVSLFYQKENSPWALEISANNIFNIEFKQRNSFSSILVSDEKIFILPRIIMFKATYKL